MSVPLHDERDAVIIVWFGIFSAYVTLLTITTLGVIYIL